MLNKLWMNRFGAWVAFVALVAAVLVLLTLRAAPRVTHAAPDVCDRLPHAMVGGIDLSGRWHADGEDVVVTHVGASVTGIAVYDEGGTATYTGCFDGHTFYMEYTNAVDDGYAELVLSADGATLHGYWYSYEDDGRHHDWTLTRVR